jgi:hypothetical protein
MWQNMDATMCLRLHEQDMRRAWQRAQSSRLHKVEGPTHLIERGAVRSLVLAVVTLMSVPRLLRRAAE